MADIADKIIRFTNVTGAPQKFVKALKQRSPELRAIAEKFRQIVNQRRMPIASFYELHAFTAIPCMNFVVVTKDSAILHIPSERLYGAERNHRNIAKFENTDDEVFQQVVDSLAFFMKNGTVSSNARVFIPWDTMFLRARLCSKRLPLEYYKPGRLYEGCKAADTFLESLEAERDRQGWTNRDNDEVGILRALTVEHHPPEPELSPRERWQKRADFIDAWKPLHPNHPSTLENYIVGLGLRMRGKLAKDFGQFKEAYFGLKEYCELYAERGSREEGWAIGDFGQLVVELEETEDGKEILADLAAHGTNFGEKVPLTECARACDLSS
ncbi:Uu.00g000620.m01.CDS01 [Anthostomella pinea]|uniref:Uu.00g000620.m01.CDS01 n=1 Tax=Anthostomella pinea TaxID=933095 RepID=A0AAI8VDX8_9PEZI|nr:Uu.00g000620.m01.CDS01 [Anthostomella pinea]